MRLCSLAGPGRTHDLGLCIAWSEMAEDARFELARGCPPTRFPTMLTSVHQGSPPSVTWPDRNWWGLGGRPRTQANETIFETSRPAGRHQQPRNIIEREQLRRRSPLPSQHSVARARRRRRTGVGSAGSSSRCRHLIRHGAPPTSSVDGLYNGAVTDLPVGQDVGA